MKKLTIMIFTFVFIATTGAYAGQFTLTTIAPAPSGHHTSTRYAPSAAPVTCDGTVPGHEGYIYFNNTSKKIFLCDPDGWKPLSTMWDRAAPGAPNNVVYAISKYDNLSIGTYDPMFRLTIFNGASDTNDSGILSYRPSPGGATLPAIVEGAGTKLIWYPAKSAFRVGSVTGTKWDDANIATYSNALGTDNEVTLSYSGIASGQSNTVGSANPPDTHSFIGGGSGNTIRQGEAFIGGGTGNTIGNAAGGYASVIAGGRDNDIVSMGMYGIIVGGQENQAGTFDFVGGGYQNIVNSGLIGVGSTIVGGQSNVINNTVTSAFIGGGSLNNVKGLGGVIPGGTANVTGVMPGETIGGGTGNTTISVDLLKGHAAISGGKYNQAGDFAVVGGGERNVASGSHSVIGGGGGLDAGAGQEENIASGESATIGGGYGNTVSGIRSTIAGGINNTVTSNFSTIGGGWGNTVETNNWATVAGGVNNTASGQNSFVGGGGEFNVASGTASVVAGGTGNVAAGNYSMAGGAHMEVLAAADNTFAWGHGALGTPVQVSQPDSFVIATGNVGVGVLAPQTILHVGKTTSGEAVIRLEPMDSGPADMQIGDIWHHSSGAICAMGVDLGAWVNLLDPYGTEGDRGTCN